MMLFFLPINSHSQQLITLFSVLKQNSKKVDCIIILDFKFIWNSLTVRCFGKRSFWAEIISVCYATVKVVLSICIFGIKNNNNNKKRFKKKKKSKNKNKIVQCDSWDYIDGLNWSVQWCFDQKFTLFLRWYFVVFFWRLTLML